MKRQPFVSFVLAGVSLTSWGLKIPSSFSKLTISNGQITSYTSWELKVVVGGDSTNKMNAAAFEALLYSAAQAANSYKNSAGIPISFLFGWCDEAGSVKSYASYQGFTLNFKVSASGLYLIYTLSGYASLAIQASLPVINVPAIHGMVQPSAIAEGLARALNATSYYQLDIDHNDAPTYVNHGTLTTSFINYIRGSRSGSDDYGQFPGLLALSKSYNATRDAAGIVSYKAKKLSQILNNHGPTPISQYLKISFTDNTPQCSSFSFWIDEPTMTNPGVIHYKSNSGLSTQYTGDVLEYGTANTNILSLSGSYSGVAYNMTDMSFKSVGFTLDGSGNAIAQAERVVNSWSATLSDVYQSASMINDVNALASQFSSSFNITIPGAVKAYTVAQPVSLLVMSGNTVSPVTGIYNIMSVSHEISNSFVTSLRVQRLVMSSANEVAISQNIKMAGSSKYIDTADRTKNIISPYKVDFGTLYPNFSHMTIRG